jgi:hypothetical protein
LKLIPMLQPKQLLYSPPTFYWNLNTIQENKITLFLAFFFHSFFFFFFFQRNFIPFLYFFLHIFFFWTITTKIIMHPHTCLLATTIHFPKQKDIRSHYHRLANISKQRWDGMGEQRKRLMSDQFKRAS